MISAEPVLIPITFVVTALIIPLTSLITKNRYVFASIQLIASAIALALSVTVLTNVIRNGVLVYPLGGWPPPIGIAYTVDFINATYGVIACLLAFLVSVYSFWYYSKIIDSYWLSTLMLLLLSGVTGCIYTGDLFNFFVMLEILAISSYALVAFYRRRKWAVEAAVSYAFIGALATTFFLFGVAFIYLSFGTLNIADVSAKAHNISTVMDIWSGSCIDGECHGNIMFASAMAIAFMLWALTFEAGIFPNNYWLPSAYTEAPTPASAIFAGIVDKVGTYGVLRLFLTVFTPYGSVLMFEFLRIPFRDLILYILSILGLITGFLGGIIMAIQKDVKRLLSYSTISHIGLMFLALVGLTSNQAIHVKTLTIMAILFHSITHAIGEAMMFLGLGALATIANSKRIEDLYGYGRVYTYLSLCVALGALSLLGVPPLGGFFSKYTLFLALFSAGAIPYAISIIAISGLSAIGYFKLIYGLFAHRPKEVKKERTLIATGVCLTMVIILLVLGALYIQGILGDILYKNSLRIVTPEGLKEYVYSVEYIAKILGGT